MLALTVLPSVHAQQTTWELPFTDTFDDASSLSKYIIIDQNKDKSTWTFGHDHAGYLSSMYNGADDYLLTPELPLQAAGYYELRYLTWSYSNSWTERLETLIGLGSDPTAFSIVENAFDITGGPAGTLTRSSVVRVPADGNYRFAFHAISAHPDFWLFIDDLIIRELDASTPVAATGIHAEAQAEGDLEAVLSFTAPARDIADKTLPGISHVNIYRNEKLIATTEAIPGGNVTYTDTSMEQSGYMTYKVTACIGDVEGQESESVTVFVGEDSPVSPNVKLVDNADGTAIFSWEPEPLGYNKLYVNNERMLYDVYQLNQATGKWQPLEKDFREKQISVAISTEGQQALAGFGVVARNKTGNSSMATTRAVAGKPYPLPFKETFADGHLDNPFWMLDGNGSNDFWQLTTLQDVDGTGGSAVFQARYANDYSTYESGKIGPLNDADNLHLLYYYNFNISHYGCNTLKVILIAPDGTETTIREWNSESHTTNQWYIDEVDLSSYNSLPYIRIAFRAEEKQAGEAVLIDGIRLRDIKDYDLEAILYSPTEAHTGEEQTFHVLVNNIGNKAAGDFDILLHIGDSILTQPAGDLLGMGQARYYTFRHTFGVSEIVDDQPVQVYAEAYFTAEEAPEDNVSMAKWVTLIAPSVSAVTNLQAASAEDGIRLTWTAPGSTGSITESFEDYDSWANGDITAQAHEGFIGDWKVVDGDKNSVVAPDMFSLPSGQSQQAFLVVTPSDINGISSDNRYAPHSGSKYLFSPNTTAGNSDDWLISPVLNGKAQTVKFYAKMAPLTSYASRQEFNVLYSTGGNATTDFKKIGETYKERNKNDWTEYEVTLPEGTRYFALQSVMRYGMGGLMIDDISFEAGALPIDHYNVYRDRHLICSLVPQAGTELSFVDRDSDSGEHLYHVSVVYDDGTESVLSNTVTATFATGIEANEELGIEKEELDDAVYDLAGRRVSAEANSSSLRSGAGGAFITLHSSFRKGIYIVKGKKIIAK